MVKKIAIYARYSSDKQSDKSVDDQISECHDYVIKNFPESQEVLVFSDRAISGRHSNRRDGYNELKKNIRSGNVTILVADTLDRLSRDVGDSSNLYKLCEFNKVEMFTIQDGKITLLLVGVKGTMNDIFINNLSHQVRRSQRSRAKEGKMFGLPYGYNIKLRNGREVRGERAIDKAKAKVVRDIFTMYADGHSLGSIIQILNARGAPSPKNSKWTKQSLMGSKLRREGILCNDIYRGKVIWNLKSKRINPETGGVNYFINPESEWEVTQNEELRIVSDELWAKCDLRKWAQKPSKKASPRHLVNPLRSLVFCGVCSSKKNLADRKRYVCSAFRFYRTCKNARGTQYDKIIEFVFDFLTEKLNVAKPTFYSKIASELHDKNITKAENNTKIEALNVQISALVETIGLQGVSIPEIADRISKLEHERASLKVENERKAVNVESPEAMIHSFKQALIQLKLNLSNLQFNDQNRIHLTCLIKKIILTPTDRPHGETIHIDMQPDAWVSYYRLLQNQKS